MFSKEYARQLKYAKNKRKKLLQNVSRIWDNFIKVLGTLRILFWLIEQINRYRH